MKKKVLLILCVSLLSFVNCKAQEPDTFYCGFDSLLSLQIKQYPKAEGIKQSILNGAKRYRQENPDFVYYPKPFSDTSSQHFFSIDPSCFKTRYALPVIVHIFHLPGDTIIGTGSNISNDHVQQAMVSLNKSFAAFNVTDTLAVNTGIQYFLANVGPDSNGIIRYASTLSNTSSIDSFVTIMDLIDPIYKTGKFINVIILDVPVPSSMRGFATVPHSWTQMIVIQRRYFGDYNACVDCQLYPNSRGKTTAHEFGHYLGLFHTYHSGCAGMDSTDCDVEGDGCCDTPPVHIRNTGCPTYVNSCNETPDLPDQTQNFLDNTEEECSYLFTRNQTEIMYSVLQQKRKQLIDVEWLMELNPDICLFSAVFKVQNNLLCDTGTVQLTGIKYKDVSNLQYHWTIYDSTSNIILDTVLTDNNKLSHFFNTVGIYDIRLRLTYQTDTAEEYFKQSVWLRNCEDPLPSEKGQWFFGSWAGLVFTPGGTRPSLDALLGPNGTTINADEGCVSICDSLGNLRFYGGGTEDIPNSGRLFNKFHDTINNPITDTLYIHGEPAQSTLVIPCPFAPGKTMLLHCNDSYEGPLYYTLLESDSAGLYHIVPGTRNTPVNLPQMFKNPADSAIHIKEYMTAAPKCNGVGYWLAVVCNYANNAALTIISIDSDGINFVDSSLVDDFTHFHFGQGKFSPDGTKFAFRNLVYDFDRLTGKVTLKHILPFHNKAFRNIYGVSFSPNSRYLYWISEDLDRTAFIYRVNLGLNDPIAKIETIGKTTDNKFFHAMQLGPDNRLYISEADSRISVIKHPDKKWDKNEINPLEYEPFGVPLQFAGNGGNCLYGLPNFVEAQKIELVPDTIYYSIRSCNTVQFTTTVQCADTYLWLFGDGDTSHQKEPEHTYSIADNYLVKLVLNSTDTVYVTVNLEAFEVNILGVDTICDNNNAPYQAVGNFSELSDFNWEMDSGNYFHNFQQFDLVYIDLHGLSSKLKVTVYDHERDCSASDSMTIVYHNDLDYNFINGGNNNLVFCNNHVGVFSMTGSTPTGGDGSYNYQWLISYDSLIWQYLDEQTSKNLSTMTVDTIAFIQRFVESKGCEHLSNIVKVFPKITNNKLHFNHGPCINSLSTNFARIYGDSAKTIPGGFEYKWQVSSDNNFWVNHLDYLWGNQVGKPTRYEPNLFDTTYIDIEMLYFRRVIRADGTCEHRSNVINVVNFYHEDMNKIKFYSEDSSIIHGVEEVQPDNRYAVVWQKSCNNIDWEDITESYSKDSLWNAGEHGSFYIRRTIKSILPNGQPDNCFEKISNSLSPKEPLFSITSHPLDYHASYLLDSATFEVAHNGKEGTQVQWQVSMDGGETWTDIGSATGLLYKVSGDPCNDNLQFRAKVFNVCQTEFSNPAEMIVTPGAGSKYFLWLRDLPSDTAGEPHYRVHSSNYLFSPDILPSHFSSPSIMAWPMHYVIGTISSGGNMYIHTKIRNKGTDTSRGGKLYLYVSQTGFHPEWDFSFTTQLQSYQISMPPFTLIQTNQNWGTEINDTGIFIPPIPPGGETWITYYWTGAPSFLTSSTIRVWSADFNFSSKKSLIYLARIEACENKPYGMTFPEVKYNGSNKLTALQNIRSNARIAALHSEITPMRPPRDGQNVLDRMPDKWNTVEADPYNRPYKLVMNSDSTKNYFNDGEVYIYFDDNMWDAWINGGSRGAGFVVVEDNVFKIDALQPVYWDSMTLDQDSTGYIGYSLHYKPSAPMIGGMQHELFRFSLHTDTFELGEFWLHTEIQSGMEGSAFNGDDTNDATSLKETQTTPLVFSARPNPFSNELKVFVANFEQGSSVTMFDMNGKQLFSQSLNNNNTEQVLTFQTANLAEGVYYVHYRSQNRNMVRKIVLVR